MAATSSKCSIEGTFLRLIYDRGEKVLLVDVAINGKSASSEQMTIGLAKGLTELGLITGDRIRCTAQVEGDRLLSPSKFEKLGPANNCDKVQLLAGKLHGTRRSVRLTIALKN